MKNSTESTETAALDHIDESAPKNTVTSTTVPLSTEQPRGVWGWIWFATKAIEIRLRFIAVLVAIMLFFVYRDTIGNYWDKWSRPDSSGAATSSDEEFYCPMHPSVVRPGLDPSGAIPKCPICGMPLSKRKKGEAAVLPTGVTARVQLSPERIQLAGIETAEVTYQPLVKEIATVGYVTYDESRLSEITTRVAGYVEKLYIDKTWINVEADEPLAEVYSPELYSGVRELLLAQDRKIASEMVRSARERLRLLGISDSELDEIVQSGRANHRLIIRSPQTGHIIRKEVKQGGHIEAGMTLFEVANLSAVWIEADVYERDIPFLREGQGVEATVEAFPNRVFRGKVSLVHPHLDPATRTNRVRFEVENPEHDLRPGMFATVRIKTPLSEIEPFKTSLAQTVFALPRPHENSQEFYTCPMHPDVMTSEPGKCPKCDMELERKSLGDDQRLIWWCPMHPKVTSDKAGGQCDECGGMKLMPKLLTLAGTGEVLAVPERAVIDTGREKIVYIERDPGVFEGVEVELGPRVGAVYAVVKGLEAGNRVAAAGSFLIDAENRLNPAAAGTYFGASGGPQTAQSRGAQVESRTTDAKPGEAKAPATIPIDVKKPSEEDLKNIAQLGAEDRELAIAQRLCPITGEPLGSMGVPHRMVVRGQTIFTCCEGCEPKVRAEPDRVLKRVAELREGK